MFQEVTSFWKNRLDFRGRARRREYWVAFLWNSIISALMVVIAYLCFIFAFNVSGENIVLMIVSLVIGLIAIVYLILSGIGIISLSVRRCHDIGFSGWVFLLCMIGSICCGLGSIVWLVFCFLDSKEDNKWGPNPKSPENNVYSGSGSIILSVIVYIAFVAVLIIGIWGMYVYLSWSLATL